jgi:phosphoribosyl 1,2-cyclic phosphodiesterase
MKFQSLASSSLGNCYLISDGSSQLLVECGISIQRIMNVVDLSKIDGCLLTHEHGDHSKSVKDILKFTKVYSSSGTLETVKDKQNISKDYDYRLVALKPNTEIKIGTFKVIPFNVQHDAIDPFGYLIYSTITKKKLLFATDTFYIKPRFKGLNIIAIECNYSKELMSSEITKAQRDRLYKSHFELENVKSFLKANDLKKVEQIYLLHLSNTNANAKLFKQEIEALTGIPVEVCKS